MLKALLWPGSFTSICCCEEILYISEEFLPHIAPALEELVEARMTEVLPTLENIFLEGLQPLGPLPERHKEFISRTTAHQSPCSSFPLGQESGT